MVKALEITPDGKIICHDFSYLPSPLDGSSIRKFICEEFRCQKFSRGKYMIVWNEDKNDQINPIVYPMIQIYDTVTHKPISNNNAYGSAYVFAVDNDWMEYVNLEINNFVEYYNIRYPNKLIQDDDKYVIEERKSAEKCVII